MSKLFGLIVLGFILAIVLYLYPIIIGLVSVFQNSMYAYGVF